MPEFTHLFQPGRIGSLEVKNRIVMAPMGTFTADDEGYITDRTIDYYVERAEGGVGLIISQATCAHAEARAPGRSMLNEDKYIPRLRDLSRAVHEQGGKMAIQLIHHGRMLAVGQHLLKDPDEVKMIGPSVVHLARTGAYSREATQEDIDRIVAGFAEAARRVKDAGFDGVEFHGAHGYIISDFLSPRANRRTDAYGGTTERRARFACEILSSARRRVGPDFPIILRVSGSDYLDGGINIEEVARQAPLLVEAGADALHISASAQETTQWQFLSYLYPDAGLVHLAEEVKKVVKAPVIAVAKIGDPVLADRILREGRADFVAMGRPLLADPYLPRKAQEGQLDEIRYCIFCLNCNREIRRVNFKGNPILCTVNPGLLREREFILKPAPRPKKVVVIGGGLAGMEAARTLAERGHHVSLYEKSDRLGGQWNLASLLPEKAGFAGVTERMSRQLYQAGVDVHLGAEATADLVKSLRPEAVVMATGATPLTPDIRGIDRPSVVQALDVIAGRAQVGARVLVAGGRERGMEVADLLASQGKKVFLATRSQLGRGVIREIFLTLRERLVEKGVPFFENAPLYEVGEKGVYLAHNKELIHLPVDTVVLALGSKPENRLAEELQGLVLELYSIGDCVEPRDARDAVVEGAEVGRRI
ncbi:MAG: FAD-dependent oxidoreductase [Chloroflexi bacterium]|nr:FAD-dependent oxidoreductase [Chloroflexota bacterium]